MKSGTRLHRFSVILKASIIYFGLVFGVGFVLGTLRVLFLAPYLGERLAELMESPLMLITTVLGAKWVVRKFRITAAVNKIALGLLALALLIALEFTVVLWLRGLTLADYFRERDPVSGTVYYLLLVAFAVMPLLIGRKQINVGH